MPTPVYGPIETVTMSARVRTFRGIQGEPHAGGPVAERDPDRPQDRCPIAILEVRRLAEHRGVHPDRAGLQEADLASIGGHGLADIDGRDAPRSDQLGRRLEVAWDAEGAGDVHHAAARQRREGRVGAQQLLGEEPGRPVTAGRDDDVDAVGDRGSDRVARRRLALRLHDVIAQAVALARLRPRPRARNHWSGRRASGRPAGSG